MAKPSVPTPNRYTDCSTGHIDELARKARGMVRALAIAGDEFVTTYRDEFGDVAEAVCDYLTVIIQEADRLQRLVDALVPDPAPGAASDTP